MGHMAPTLYRFRGRFRPRASRTRRGGGGDWENGKSILKGIQVAGPRVEEKIPSIYCGNRGKIVTVFGPRKVSRLKTFWGCKLPFSAVNPPVDRLSHIALYHKLSDLRPRSGQPVRPSCSAIASHESVRTSATHSHPGAHRCGPHRATSSTHSTVDRCAG